MSSRDHCVTFTLLQHYEEPIPWPHNLTKLHNRRQWLGKSVVAWACIVQCVNCCGASSCSSSCLHAEHYYNVCWSTFLRQLCRRRYRFYIFIVVHETDHVEERIFEICLKASWSYVEWTEDYVCDRHGSNGINKPAERPTAFSIPPSVLHSTTPFPHPTNKEDRLPEFFKLPKHRWIQFRKVASLGADEIFSDNQRKVSL